MAQGTEVAFRHRCPGDCLEGRECVQMWGGGSFGAGERVASDGWKPDVARV